jgi:hypothetical protein
MQLAKIHENQGAVGQNVAGGRGEIDEPMEESKPLNWLIRSVRFERIRGRRRSPRVGTR